MKTQQTGKAPAVVCSHSDHTASYISCAVLITGQDNLTGITHPTACLQVKELAHALRNLPQELKNFKTIAAS